MRFSNESLIRVCVHSSINHYRIQDLELAVDRMKQQQEHLHKRLKDESDKKAKFEVGHQIFAVELQWLEHLWNHEC